MGIRVFHCDDSEAFTRLVRFWLAEHAEIEHVGAAHSPSEALAALPAARPDVIVLDTMGRPRESGVLAAVRAAAPAAKVIVYSGYVRLVAEDELGEGADAYVQKGDDDRALVAAIRGVVVGAG